MRTMKAMDFDQLPSDLKPFRKHIERIAERLRPDLPLTELQFQQLRFLENENCLLTDQEFDERLAKGQAVDDVM